MIHVLILATVCIGTAEAPVRSEPGRVASREDDRAAVSGASKVGHPMFLSPHAAPIAVLGKLVYVANTPADTVDIIDTDTRALVRRVKVGVNPVGIAVRPDGKEVWVTNHVSDSVSVIDADPASPTLGRVISVIQELDPATKATRFDEPAGVAFASNAKAYVALSSENKIAVIDVAARKTMKMLDITAQDPRAIFVRGRRLYVIPFESNNRTQLSGGVNKPFDGDLVTFDAHKHSVANNNVLSLGAVLDIVKNPRVPDRDLFVFDTETDKLVTVVDTLGTLLYGITVDAKGTVYIAQTDARNDANGRAGTKKHGLAELGNRAFLNRITAVSFNGDAPAAPRFFDLEPAPPLDPKPGAALATPFAIGISDDDSTLVASAAGSNKIFTLSAATGAVLGVTTVGAAPEGIALESTVDGKPARAWVLNAAANTISLVDLTDVSNPRVSETVVLDDPTHPQVKRGRIAFHNAAASTSGTYSCASCHPDGHTDQLLWVLNTPIVTGGDQIMPRLTMPARGLRDTAPFHWDGIPGDPYGGNNSANINGETPPNSRADIPESSTRNLVDGGLASTMRRVGDTGVNDEGKPGALSAAERDDMAKFLLAIPYPPAQRRGYDNVLSESARKGFRLFHIEGDLQGGPRPNVCGDCHRMPYWVSTNTPGTGMEAPTWRGAYDRWVILPQGRLNIIDFDFFREVAERGAPERSIWRFSWSGRVRFDPVWDMVLEGSTGFSGAFARQVALNRETANAELTSGLLDALEQSAREGGVILQGEGAFLDAGKAVDCEFEFDPALDGGSYVQRTGDHAAYSRAKLKALAAEGGLISTFTGRLGIHSDVDHPQPALWTMGPIEKQRGRQIFPVLFGRSRTLTMSGRHIAPDAFVIVDGRRVKAEVSLAGEAVAVELAAPPPPGTHFLQVQNPEGLFSNDFIFHVAENENEARALLRQSLREVLREVRWDRLIGTWVDADTKGAAVRTTYAWMIENKVIEITTKDRANESVSLMSINPDTGEIRHMGADRSGTLYSGKWEFRSDGDAVLEADLTTGEAGKPKLKVTQRLLDDDTLEVRVASPQKAVIKMIRAK